MNSFVNLGFYPNLLVSRSVAMPALFPCFRRVSAEYHL